MVRPLASCLFAPIMLGLATPATGAAGDKAKIEQVIRRMVEGQDAEDIGTVLAYSWPNGYFAVKGWDQPRSAFTRKPWAKLAFAGLGVNDRSRILGTNITVKGNRASAWALERSRREYAGEFSGLSFESTNWIILERRRSEWRVLSWERSVREIGSNAEWRRKHQ